LDKKMDNLELGIKLGNIEQHVQDIKEIHIDHYKKQEKRNDAIDHLLDRLTLEDIQLRKDINNIIPKIRKSVIKTFITLITITGLILGTVIKCNKVKEYVLEDKIKIEERLK
jgi:hypothetical protein